MKNKKLIACWDTYKARNNFGSLLIFLSEVEAISYEYDRIDIVCIGLQKNIHVFISVMQFFSGIKNLLFFVDMDEYDRYVDDDGSDKWQNIVYNINESSYNESTLFLQKIYLTSKNLKRLTAPVIFKERVNRWVSKHCNGRRPVILHLKNNPNSTQSNASQESWYKFILHATNEYGLYFVLIGKDIIDDSIAMLPNTVLTNALDGDTELDIALVLTGFLFMGMSSGPCNAAIFSNTPYLIWKHPDHHADEMRRELQDNNAFSFARSNQLFLREYDTYDSIMSNFKKIYRNLNAI